MGLKEIDWFLIFDRIAESYQWHMEEDYNYAIDRHDYREMEGKVAAIKKAITKLESKPEKLKGSIYIESRMYQDFREKGWITALKEWQSLVQEFDLFLLRDRTKIFGKREARIPLKVGLIVYSVLHEIKKNREELAKFRLHLNSIGSSVSEGASLRELINSKNIGTWKFDDSFLPVPNDHEETSWHSKYMGVLARSIFKGAGDHKADLLRLGKNMAFGDEGEYLSLKDLGFRHKEGMSPLLFYKLACEKVNYEPSFKYIGLLKKSPLQKSFDEETLES